MKRLADWPLVPDCAFLFALIMLSALPYLFRIGFYADDWNYLAAVTQGSSQNFAASFGATYEPEEVITRPVEYAYLFLGFKAFGRRALPYHLVDTVVLGLVTVLLYLTLTELRTGRGLALVISLVFGFLPHYSTDRFWLFAQHATLSMALAFLGIYALLRSVRPKGEHQTAWVFLATLALLLSILSYEVAFGIIAASLAMIGWMRYKDARASSKRVLRRMGGIVCTAAILLIVVLSKGRMQSRLIYHHHFFTRFWGLIWHSIVQAVQFNIWTYFLDMPAVLARLCRHSAFSFAAAATATVLFCLTTAYLLRTMKPSEIPTRRMCLWLIALGFVVFALGYGLFLSDLDTNFSTMGVANRVAIGSAPGASCVLVAAMGLACSFLESPLARLRAFCLSIAAICGVNCLVVSGIAFFWENAASQQAAILGSVAANVRSLPHGSILLLDGFCRYYGPGIVFEGDEATGAIQLTLGDFSLTGDVISSNMRFDEAAVETVIYGLPFGHYPYGNHLFVYNVQRKSLTVLPSKEASTAYLDAMNPIGNGGCPAARDGDGVQIF